MSALPLTSIRGIGPALASRLSTAGLATVTDVAHCSVDRLVALDGISPHTAPTLQAAALALLPADPSPADPSPADSRPPDAVETVGPAPSATEDKGDKKKDKKRKDKGDKKKNKKKNKKKKDKGDKKKNKKKKDKGDKKKNKKKKSAATATKA